jgi:hypothetical protein
MATKKGTELQVTFFFTAQGCFLVENHIFFLEEIGHCLCKKSDFQNILQDFTSDHSSHQSRGNWQSFPALFVLKSPSDCVKKSKNKLPLLI